MKHIKVEKCRWIPYYGKGTIDLLNMDGFHYSIETKMFAWFHHEWHSINRLDIPYEKGDESMFGDYVQEFAEKEEEKRKNPLKYPF